MQERNEPLPGLLYEARVRQNIGNDNASTSIPASSNGNPVYRIESTSRPASRADVEAQSSSTPTKPPKPSRDTVGSLSTAMRPAAMTDDEAASRHSSVQDGRPSSNQDYASQATRSPDSQPLPSFLLVQPVPSQGAAQRQQQQEAYEEAEEDEQDRSIKLGLGDFVFYSLLCAKAALVSFTTFIAVFVVVLFGLAMTLVLLAVYRTALPALPISILLGLIFFFAVDAVVVPFVDNFALQIAYA
jgi:presenilin 1